MDTFSNTCSQLDPVMIITRSLLNTSTTNKNINNNELMANVIDQLIDIHCPKNIVPKQTSAIDKVKVKFEYNTADEKLEIHSLLSAWLSQQGISISSHKPNLTHFTHGSKLYSKDQANILCGTLKSHSKKRKIQFEITGGGCNYVNANKLKFSSLYAICKHLNGIVTYLDIAVDDHSGKFNIPDTRSRHKRGRYAPKSGKGPELREYSSPSGKTLYIGADASYRRTKTYEKGKEQGYPKGSNEYENLTRHEVTLEGRKHHVIPLDALLTPDRDFLGAYPKAHKRILKDVKPRCIRREVALKKFNSFSKSMAHNKHQWGKSNNILGQLTGDKEEAFKLISRDGVPDKMKLPGYIDLEIMAAITEVETGLPIAKAIEQQIALHLPNCKEGI